jgi:23S rRNA (adenine2503-C2)-methyltransferase
MPFLVDHDRHTLAAELANAGHKPVHANALLRQFYAWHGSLDWNQLSVGAGVRGFIESTTPLRRSRTIRRSVAADGTTKLLVGFDSAAFGFADQSGLIRQAASAAGGGAVESVLMPSHRDGIAAGCVSSQIGCAMGCDFCASTKRGLERNLEAGEIVEQFLHLKEQAAKLNRRLKTLVFMGMGEPLLNFENVTAAIRRIADPDLGALGWRQITVSTVGIVPGIDRLRELDLNVHLAISLHAPDDATRTRLVPSNRRYPVAEVMNAGRRFEAATNRIPTIEYCMLADVNDSDEQAHLLAELMHGFRAHVNLIPYNPIGAGVTGIHYQRPTRERLLAFLDILRSKKVVAHFRDTRGDDVHAACGQLRETEMLIGGI